MKSYLFIILVLVFVVSLVSAQERPKPSRAVPNPSDTKPQQTPGAKTNPEQSTKDQVPVPAAIANQLAASSGCSQSSGNEGIQKFTSSLSAHAVNVDQTGTAALMIAAHDECSCATGGNCATWLYRKNGDKYDLLFDAGKVLSIKAGQAITNGYRDLMTEAYSSPTDTLMSFYKWDGNKYLATECVIHKRMSDRFGRSMFKNIKVNCQTKQMNRP